MLEKSRLRTLKWLKTVIVGADGNKNMAGSEV
jgi:hypothetical protein